MNRLEKALNHPVWADHHLGDIYYIDGKKNEWKIAYYPIFECGKTGEVYDEPRALIELPMFKGTDFREMPLRYLSKKI